MATSQERENLFLGKGEFSTTPFYKAQNRTTGINRVNELLKDESLRKTMNPPYDISGYGSLFECTDIDLLEKLHDEIVKRPENEASHNLLSSVLHTYIYMLCIIDKFGINDAIANRSKYETPKGKITWNKVQEAIAAMKKRKGTSSGTTGVPSASITVKTPVTPPIIHLGDKALECKGLLEANHNIILSGAPGTGKTYMANQIALDMTGSEYRIGFVQFHPSYDYTDFVEGLRPTTASGSSIGFERKDGLFKNFCEKALNDSEQKYVFIIDEINRGEMSKVFGELFFSIDPGYRGKDGKVRTQYANMVATPNAFDKVLGKSDPKDCGYFFVPENVYIIGTMNDIDRSVDSMDFAMRRRFMIKEIKASDTQKEMLTNAAVIAKMDALNNIIEGVSPNKIKAKLGSSYALGASYFKKYELYTSDSFKALWDNHLEGILREYLRGTQDPDSDLKVLKEAYDKA